MKSAIAIGLFAVASSASILPVQKGVKAIPGQYIIQFKEGVEIASHLEALNQYMSVDSPANEFLHHYKIGKFTGYSLRCTDNVLSFIRRAEKYVLHIEEDQMMSISDVQNNPPSWGLDRTSQRNLPLDNAYHYPSSQGSGVDMYTIDTGILVTHNDFEGRASWGITVPGGASDEDRNGHGTHCSGTMAGASYGIAKEADLIAVKVLGDLGFGTTADVIAGVNWVADQHNANRDSVGNMSLGGGASATLDNAVNAAVNEGVFIAVAAGNDNANACNYSPARAANAICVGATTNTDAKASFSNYGTCIDIHAPGNAIVSAYIGSNSASRSLSGTSMSSPHVAGVMALYLAEGVQPTNANLQAASTKNVISGLPAGTVNYLLYSSENIIDRVN